MENDQEIPKRWGVGTWILVVILPLILGILFSLFIPRPIIGVIRLESPIESFSAKDIITQVVYAREHPEIKAVVIVVNSPGGTVSDSESIYLEVSRLRQQKPVISVVEGMAASGAYYLAVGTDYIFAKPSSLVGNIGVISYMPPTPQVFEEVYSTGPYKLWGEPRDQAVREMETLKQGFLKAIMLGRGDRLKLATDQILSGRIWLGSEALKNGIVDKLGTQSEAYDMAGQMARISHFDVKNLRDLAGLSTSISLPFFFQLPNGINTGYPKDPGYYYLYVPQKEVQK